MKILMTGGTGFIGKALVRMLLEQRPNIMIYSLTRQSVASHHKQLQNLQCDLTDVNSLLQHKDIFKEVDSVIHLAGYLPNYTARAASIEMLEHNLIGSLNLTTATDIYFQSFIYISSLDVYGIPQMLPVTESHPTEPVSYYGAAKLAAEKFLKIYFAEKKIPLTILRLTQIYGPGEPVVKAIPSFIKKVKENEAPVFMGDGSELRDYLYVDDAAQAIINAVGLKKDGVFNIASGSSRSIAKVWETISRVANSDIEPILKERIKPRYDSVLDITKAAKELNFAPSVTFEDGIRRQLEYHAS